ncbi:hypothetical protein JCM11251_007516 [Rhodosporidiobolus azoricus]
MTLDPASRPFDKLPQELLQLIVESVRRQDEVFLKSGIGRTKPLHRLEPEYDPLADAEARREHDERWQTWNKAKKGAQAVRPLLKENGAAGSGEELRRSPSPSHSSKLRAPFEDNLALHPEILAAIDHLDFSSSSPDRILPVAPYLHLLPVTRLTFDRHMITLGSRIGLPRKIRCYTLKDLSVDDLERFFDLVDLTALTQLDLTLPDDELYNYARAGVEPFTFEHARPRVLEAFRKMDSLETLRIEDDGAFSEDYSIHPSWLGSFTFPALQSLTIVGHENTERLLRLALAFAPRVQSLTVEDVELWCDSHVPALPSLRHLTIHHFAGDDLYLHFPPASSLVTLTIHTCHSHAEIWLHNLPVPSTLPSTLRLITLHLETTTPPDEIFTEYRSKCLVRGTLFQVVWRPDLDYFGEMLSRDGYDNPENRFYSEDVLIASDAARDTMEWARRELDRALEVDDDRTAHEIVQALLRLRERQAIALQ